MYASREHGFFSISGNLATQFAPAVMLAMTSADCMARSVAARIACLMLAGVPFGTANSDREAIDLAGWNVRVHAKQVGGIEPGLELAQPLVVVAK